MDPTELTGINPVNITGTNPSQDLRASFTPTTTNPLGSFYYNNNSSEFFDKIKKWFTSLGTGINNFGNYFRENFPDSIFNFSSMKTPDNSPVKWNDYLAGSDLPDWIHDLFNNAIGMFNENINRQYQFNREEADKDRLWQEYMSNTAYLRAAEQLKELGINPLLAFGSLNPASTPGGSSASGSLANSNSLFSSIVSAAVGDKKVLSNLLGAILGIFRILAVRS